MVEKSMGINLIWIFAELRSYLILLVLTIEYRARLAIIDIVLVQRKNRAGIVEVQFFENVMLVSQIIFRLSDLTAKITHSLSRIARDNEKDIIQEY